MYFTRDTAKPTNTNPCNFHVDPLFRNTSLLRLNNILHTVPYSNLCLLRSAAVIDVEDTPKQTTMFLLARSSVLLVVLLISLIVGIQSFKITKLATFQQFRASRINRDLHRIPVKLGDDSTNSNIASSFQDSPLQLNSIIQTSALMFLLSAPLGMMLDNYHGKHST